MQAAFDCTLDQVHDHRQFSQLIRAFGHTRHTTLTALLSLAYADRRATGACNLGLDGECG